MHRYFVSDSAGNAWTGAAADADAAQEAAISYWESVRIPHHDIITIRRIRAA